MIAYLVYIGGFFAMAVMLLMVIHLAVTAEDRRYAAEFPAAPAEPKELRAVQPRERAA